MSSFGHPCLVHKISIRLSYDHHKVFFAELGAFIATEATSKQDWVQVFSNQISELGLDNGSLTHEMA